jgi:ATP-dependent Clp protease ATP-binding subunit ClpB
LCLIALTKPNVGFDAGQLKSFPVKEKELLDVYMSRMKVCNMLYRHPASGE